jgi:hypothetical protein
MQDDAALENLSGEGQGNSTHIYAIDIWAIGDQLRQSLPEILELGALQYPVRDQREVEIALRVRVVPQAREP